MSFFDRERAEPLDLRDRALNKVGSERVRSDVLAQPRVRG